MDFSLNDDQTLLKDSIVQYMSRSYDFDSRMATVDSDAPYDAQKWSDFAELGWLALPFPDDLDGFGGGPVETMLLMQELGKHLVIEPYLATVVLGGGCLVRGNNDALRQKLIGGVISGDVQLALAYAEPRSRYRLNEVECKADPSGDDYVLNGEKIFVMNGSTADHLIVVARTSGAGSDEHGISLFCIDATRDGISRNGYKTVDGMHAAQIGFDDVAVSASELICELHEGLPLLAAVIQDACLAVCAEALGIMEALLQKTVDYTKSREQFGVPLSTFQALQHRMVDMFMELEQCRSLLLRAAIKSQDASPDSASAVAAVKYYIGTAGRKLGEEAVQLHGGMGVTYELDVAHLFKRLTVIDTLFGNSDFQLAQYMAADAS